MRDGVERVPSPYGHPGADDQLQRLVAGSGTPARTTLRAYLTARTRFFDQTVVSALDDGIRQVVVVAAGYDGRSLRYAKPGVRWFELDHPATQAAKRDALDRLQLDTPHVQFVAADFTTDDVAGALSTAGCDPTQRSLVVAEGVAVYLERSVLAGLLDALRRCVGPDSRLAISLSVSGDSSQTERRRAAFQARVAELGEPAMTTLTAADAEPLFAATGWRTTAASTPEAQRAHAAGFVTAFRRSGDRAEEADA